MLSALAQALPVFVIIALGFFAGRVKLIAGEQALALNRFVFLFAMPAAIFIFAATNEPPSVADLPFVGVYAAAVTAVFFIALAAGHTLHGLSRREAGGHAYATTLGNAVFLGLPIVLTIPEWGPHYLMLMLVEGILVIALGTAFLDRPEDGGASWRGVGQSLFRVVRNPLVLAMVFGFLVSLAGLRLPGPAESFFQLFGAAAGPTALFALGVSLALAPAGAIRSATGRIAGISALKLAVLPGLTFIGLYLVGAPREAIGAAMLFTVMPTAVTVFVQTSHARVYDRTVAAAITVTTLISLISVTAVLAVFN